MKRQYVFLAFALLLVGITLLFHASATQHKARTVTIGAVIPLTGANSYFGTVEKRGLEMAIDELNTSQKKYTFALKLEDSKCSPKDGITAASQLLAMEHPAAVFTSLSSVSLAIAPLFKETEPPLIIFAMDEAITAASPQVFRVYPGICEEAQNTLPLLKKVGAQKIAVLVTENPAMESYLKNILPGLADHPDTLVERFQSDDPTELRAVVAKVAYAQPDTILLNAFPKQYPNLLKALEEAHITSVKRLVGGLGLSNAVKADPTLAPATQELFLVVPSYMLADQSSSALSSSPFVQDYTRKYHEFPSYDTAYAYDACMMLGQVIREVGTAPNAIHHALLAQKDFYGATGNLRYDANRSSTTTWQMVQVKDGKFVVTK